MGDLKTVLFDMSDAFVSGRALTVYDMLNVAVAQDAAE